MSLAAFVDMHGDSCVIVDDSTGRPLPMHCFDSVEDAESFIAWVRTVHGKSPAQFDAAGLDYLQDAWAEQPHCKDCRRVLDEGRCEDCDDVPEERTAE